MLTLTTITAFWGITQAILNHDQAMAGIEYPQDPLVAGYCPARNDHASSAIANLKTHQKASTYG